MDDRTTRTRRAAPGVYSGELTAAQQALMVADLRRQGGAALIETHISFVLVAGDRAYKLKKVLRTAFLDQSTLALRERACHEELRLNRRLAPAMYLGVLPVTGTPAAPQLGGDGTAIDFAVEMRAFAQDGLWDTLAAQGRLGAAQVDELVRILVPFHDAAAVADAHGRLGAPPQVRAPLLQSLDELDALAASAAEHEPLRRLRSWETAAFARLQPALAQRLRQGRVRECHGDLHLGNVTLIDGRATVFDGIEFNEDFRWIDVMSEIAFMAMDLHAHGLPALAHRFVNGYLELGGDYDGLRVFDYYLVHRALVRTKVALLRAAQCSGSDGGEAAQQRAAAHRYLALALRVADGATGGAGPVLMLTHGVSGSGKSTLTQGLLEAAGAVRIRADVERKRLAGLQPLDRSGAQRVPGLYGAAMNTATYERLGRLATPVLESGRHAILDATFLRRAQRDAARRLAATLGVRALVLHFDADPDTLRRRLRERARHGADASDADERVLAAQIEAAEALQPDESGAVFDVPVAELAADGAPRADWAALLSRLGAPSAPAAV